MAWFLLGKIYFWRWFFEIFNGFSKFLGKIRFTEVEQMPSAQKSVPKHALCYVQAIRRTLEK